MTSKHLFILLLALFASTAAQSDDELLIPFETNNQFPPDNHSESDGIDTEGSGAGVIEEPQVATTEAATPILEDIQLHSLTALIAPAEAAEERTCPKPCVCNVEGNSNNYIVDCSGYELTELPTPLDSKTTELNLQNNKLTAISKEISALKNLKTLNVNSNEIKEIVSGSISELPQLTSLKLGNNRLIEYPQDLKNSFGLTKLEELDLGGNDMRTDLKPETFSNFKSLRKLTLPTSSSDLIQDLCVTLKESLETVCTGSCNTKTFDCPDAPQGMDELDGLLDFALPGFIALSTGTEENADPAVGDAVKTINDKIKQALSTPVETASTNEQAPAEIDINTDDAIKTIKDELQKVLSTPAEIPSSNEKSISGRSGAITPPAVDSTSNVAKTSEANKVDADIAVGATTQEKKGGVDKSVIGIIVAGMVLVVAGITIKKNWSSIKNRFNSTPRTANERVGATTNGTSPEEVPLQEKLPV